jgi:hypothetical protein
LIRLGRLALLIVAIGGFAAAHALVQAGNAMEVPVPTVTVPSLPVPTTTTPTLPVPSPPTPTVSVPPPTAAPPPTVPAPVKLPPVVTSPPPTRPAPAPQPPQSATTTTLTVGPPAPAARTATPPSSGYDYTGPSTARTPGAGRTVGARSTTRSRGLAAETHRTANRVSVRLAFLLAKAERRFLIVRGPAPSCRVVGYIPVRGRKGINTVYFAGRVHGRRLEPGVYLISLSPNRRLARGAATEYVRVVSPRRSLPLPDRARRPACGTAAAPAADQASRSVVADAAPQGPTAPATGLAAPKPKSSEKDERAAGLPDAGVLGVSTGDADEKPFLALAVLTLVGGLLIAMLILVTRFLRGNWNP